LKQLAASNWQLAQLKQIDAERLKSSSQEPRAIVKGQLLIASCYLLMSRVGML